MPLLSLPVALRSALDDENIFWVVALLPPDRQGGKKCTRRQWTRSTFALKTLETAWPLGCAGTVSLCRRHFRVNGRFGTSRQYTHSFFWMSGMVRRTYVPSASASVVFSTGDFDSRKCDLITATAGCAHATTHVRVGTRNLF